MWVGQIEQGLPLVRESYATKGIYKRAAALNAATIALAEHKQGNLAGAQRWEQIARELDPNCLLLKDDWERTKLGL